MYDRYRLKLISGPEHEPVLFQDVLDHLKINEDNTSVLESIIMTARQYCEAYTGRALIQQKWSLFLDEWPQISDIGWWDGVVEAAQISKTIPFVNLPKAPLVSVDHIYTYDQNDLTIEWENTNYYVDTVGIPGRVVLKNNSTMPVAERLVNGIEIQFTCGYGTDPESVPSPLAEGIKLICTHLHENRGDSANSAMVQSGAKTLWEPYRLIGLI